MTSLQGQGEGAHSLLYKEEEARVLSSTESQSNSEQETVMISKDNPLRAGVRYEVAMDTIWDIVSYYSIVLAEEQEKSVPDMDLVKKWETAYERMRHMYDSLDPADETRVEEVIDEYVPVAQKLWDQWHSNRAAS